MSFEPFLIIFLIFQLIKTLKQEGVHAEWIGWLRKGMIGVIIGIAVTAALDAEDITRWFWHLLTLAIILAAYRRSEFISLRPLLYPFIPLIAISILSDLLSLSSNETVTNVHGYLKIAFPFAVIWMVAQWIIANRQKKELDRERKKREAEEEEKKFISARKVMLEAMVAERTSELTKQKEELQEALDHLKDTQNQLVQSEKMASLGELTAGIAHEIQNPLNFVNNFSEVNSELVLELRDELGRLDLETQAKKAIDAIALDIIRNQDKITFHGKRADDIVKSMLMHSRTNTGEKEETDINALADEYLRLSYHGLRARDKSFQAGFLTEFDPEVGKVMVVPQDIGRVILNLVNNAFYAVNERKKTSPATYQPEVKIQTRRLEDAVEILVSDNGNGIPAELQEKIFQPFFTTKPTGRGTGLGLSLSYDIITKVHGGELTVNSVEGGGSEFVVRIPA